MRVSPCARPRSPETNGGVACAPGLEALLPASAGMRAFISSIPASRSVGSVTSAMPAGGPRRMARFADPSALPQPNTPVEQDGGPSCGRNTGAGELAGVGPLAARHTSPHLARRSSWPPAPQPSRRSRAARRAGPRRSPFLAMRGEKGEHAHADLGSSRRPCGSLDQRTLEACAGFWLEGRAIVQLRFRCGRVRWRRAAPEPHAGARTSRRRRQPGADLETRSDHGTRAIGQVWRARRSISAAQAPSASASRSPSTLAIGAVASWRLAHLESKGHLSSQTVASLAPSPTCGPVPTRGGTACRGGENPFAYANPLPRFCHGERSRRH